MNYSKSPTFIFFLLLLTLNLRLLSIINEEDFIQPIDKNTDKTELIELLSEYRDNPKHINKVDREFLEIFPFLGKKDQHKIIKYIKNTENINLKKFYHINVDTNKLNKLSNYISFKKQLRYRIDMKNRVEYANDKKFTYKNCKLLQKIDIEINDFILGVVSQKDYKETKFSDFYSYYFVYNSQSFLKKLILGKYKIYFGKGLLFNSKLGLSKSSSIVNLPMRSSTRIKPYKSSYEIWDLEGSALETKWKNTKLWFFYSNTAYDANIENNKITSFDNTGIHTNPNNEINNALEKMSGTAIMNSYNNFEINLLFAHNSFNKKFLNPQTNRSNNFCSLYTAFFFNSFTIDSEIALANQKKAFNTGIEWGNLNFEQIFQLRFYEDNFPTWHGNPMSTSSNFDNEIGFYYGFKAKFSPEFTLNCYIDTWKYPEARYLEKMPTTGAEFSIQPNFKVNQNTLKISLKHKKKEKYSVLEDIGKIREVKVNSLKLDWIHQLGRNLQFKSRFCFNDEYYQETQKYYSGNLHYFQIRFKISSFNFITRFTTYNSNVLIYVYENNVRGLFENKIFSGNGQRLFFLTKTEISDKLLLEFKIARDLDINDSTEITFQTGLSI